MKWVSSVALILLFTITCYSQERVTISNSPSFWYVYMEFQGSHYEGLPEKFDLFVQELRRQEFLPKISGDSFCIFFDSPLQVAERDTVWGVGFEIEKDTPVQSPLKKKEFAYEWIAAIICKGPHEPAVGNAHSIIIPYIEENGLEVVGPPVEIWHGNTREDKSEDLSVEILIPIREPKK